MGTPTVLGSKNVTLSPGSRDGALGLAHSNKYSVSSVAQFFNFQEGLAKFPRLVSNWSASCLSLPGMTGRPLKSQETSSRPRITSEAKLQAVLQSDPPVKLEAMLGV